MSSLIQIRGGPQALLVAAMLLLPGQFSRLCAGVVQARSPSRPDVASAIRSASSGDTVVVPPGSAEWTETLIVSKPITIQGSGVGQTILLDDVVAEKNANEALIRLETQDKGLYRLTGFEIRRGTKRSKVYFNGVIQIEGTSKTFRVDHLKFESLLNRGLFTRGSVCGVIDHCVFNLDGTAAILVSHSGWGGQSYGDGSFAAPVTWGSAEAVYVEDCVFSGTGVEKSCIDAEAGGRYVFRYNAVTNEPIICHGTETGGRMRSARSYEIYKNVLVDAHTWPNAINLRGGTGVIWGNSAVGFRYFCRLVNNRSISSFRIWGGANGLNPLDKNDPAGPLASGAHTGAAASRVLVCAGAGWKPNQWRGYTLQNTTRGVFSLVASNTADTVYFFGQKEDKKFTPADMSFNPGENFRIYRVEATLDQVGASTSDLIGGHEPRAAWPHQKVEPLYAWDNTLNGAPANLIPVHPSIREGEHFVNQQQKPGYTPFAYPHPLTQSARDGLSPGQVNGSL